MKKNGQALLIIVLLSAIILTLAISSASFSLSSSLETLISWDGEKTYFLAEGALENGFLRLLRNPGYTGEALQLEEVPCIIEVITSPSRVRAWCDSGQVIRKLEAEIIFQQGRMQVGPISEVP